MKEKEAQEQQIQSVQNNIAAMQRRIQRMKEDKSSHDAELKAIYEATAAKKAEVEVIQAKKAEKEDDLRKLREKVASRSGNVAAKQKKIDELREDDANHGDDLRRLEEEIRQLREEYQTLTRQIQHVNTSLQDCNEENDTMQRKVKETMKELQTLQSNVSGTHKQYVKEMKVLESLQRRNVVEEQKQAEVNQKREDLKAAIKAKEKELLDVQLLAEGDSKRLESIKRERDLLFQDFISAEQATQRNISWLAEKDAQKRHLQHELTAFEEHAQKKREDIYRVTKDCMKYEDDLKRHALAGANMLAEVQAREQQISTSQQEVEDVEARLKQQQTMLDAVVTERNTYSKHLGQLRHELAEMNKKFQLILNQIQQLKEELVRRDRAIIAEDAVIEGLLRQKKGIESQISTLKRKTEKKKRSAEQFHTELGKLSEVLVVANDEVAKQRRRYRDMIQERDLLANRTTQREKELTSLYEKIHAQQQLLQRGEAAYRERVQHIDQLEYQCAQLENDVAQLKEFASRLPDLRLMVNTATRELQKEKVQVRALLNEEELKVNLHPGRELMWSDPETYALTEKVQGLQRQLNQRRQQLEEREREIQIKEQAYLKAKATVAKQPGPEVAEQLSAYQQNLVKKKGQVAQIQESLQYYREQSDLYQARHEELRERLTEMAKEYAVNRQREERGRAAGRPVDDGDAGEVEEEEDYEYTGFVAPPMDPS
ncbi:flagellar associated protein [Angomonas deanei]|uniref:Cilia- and flagella-associated protein 58 central coiled coil domain-containing protein n=1 Tax=Angomonas deanei TaxID=59799 RepID=A0A7G2BZU9_9TRYP|nr:flagellar associated protein [Angomonas deanei]CAD2212795.1 hypothetical protein, conserved [Angomonas deanei]|eukprot:EPY20631.1 flagellar associated protein [Angomonas deanei]